MVCLACLPAHSQTTFATITGMVADPSGAAIPDAKITATNAETGYVYTAASNGTGAYTLSQLREGSYLLAVSAPGFDDYRVENIILAARDIRRIDAHMIVGSQAARVDVTAGATLIETETARISDSKSSEVLKTVPLNARWLWAFLNLAPNFISGPEGYRFGGARAEQSNWAIDGTTFNDGTGNAIGPQGNYIESFREVRIDLANNSAEFGGVGQLTVITKSGTNELHGAAFDYYSTPVFRARNPFAPARTTGVNHLFGGAIGGPVVLPKLYHGKNKTFFFTSFEDSLGGDTTQTLNPTVPLAAWRSGDFSALLPSTIVRDPLTKQPFPGNVIPAARINPVSQKLQDRFYPLPNFGDTSVLASQNYRVNLTRPWDQSAYWVSRVDHRFSEKDFVYGRFTFTRGFNTPFEGNLPTIGRRIQQRDTRSAMASYTHMFTPTLFNEARWGFDLNNNPISGPVNGPALVKELGLVGLAPDLPDIGGLLKVNFTGLGLAPITQVDYANPGFRNHNEEFQDHVSWTRGRHTVKVGFDLTRVEWDDLSANANLFGAVTFSNQFTGFPYADFLLGIPTTAARAFAPIRLDRNRWQYDLFAMDDFKVNSHLTLNLGIRYQLHTAWGENHGYISAFDINSGSIVVPDIAVSKVSPLFPKSYVPIVGAGSVAGFAGDTLIHADGNNFDPRIGFAYRPWGDRTVIRGGFGIFHDPVPQNFSPGSSPFVLNENAYTNPASNPDVIFPRVFTAAGAAGPSSVGLPGAVNPNLQLPYSMQYSFTIERQQWNTGFRTSYMGTNTRQGVWAYNYNSPVPDAQPFISKPRPFPQYSSIPYYTNGAGHQYHALTVEAIHPTSKGLFFQSSWTWARDIFDENNAQVSENPFSRTRDIGPAQSIPTHRWVSAATYQFPFGRGKKWLSGTSRLTNFFVGGWQLSAIYTAQSGQFLTPLWTGPDPTGTAFTTSATPAQVTIRPDVLHNPNLPSDQQTVSRWFDPSAFTAPQRGQFGTSGKGVIKGPGVNDWNMGLHKDFEFSERFRFRWELTAVNVFNHPNWSNPVTNITQTANVAVISNVGGVFDSTFARQLRMGLRLEW
jgi:hypothetical protein